MASRSAADRKMGVKEEYMHAEPEGLVKDEGPESTCKDCHTWSV